jgi:hypothetical protein
MYIDTKPTFKLTVPCSGRSPIKHLLAAGKYDWASCDLTDDHFPPKQTGPAQAIVEVVDFGTRTISNSEAQIELKKRGVEPAAIEHLLAFGAAYPDEQRKYPIIALGSVACIREHPCVPFLATDGSARFAGILAWNDEWSNAMRFLAIRKHTSRSSTI